MVNQRRVSTQKDLLADLFAVCSGEQACPLLTAVLQL